MRGWPSQLLDEARGRRRLAIGLFVKREDDVALGLTTARVAGEVVDVPIGGSVEASVLFKPSPEGVKLSSLERAVGTDVGTAEAEIMQSVNLTLSDILDERWSGAPWSLGGYSWANPEFGWGPILCGFVGKVKQRSGRAIFELRDLRQLLQGNPTPVTQKGCIWVVGSNDEKLGFCTLDMGLFTAVDQAVTAVTSQREFTCGGLSAEPDDRYGNGLLTWKTGVNAGKRVRVVSFEAGVFVLEDDMIKGVTIGDEFDCEWGCRGRFEEDCVTKFDNYLNFGGMPDAPGPDKALMPPGQDTVAPPAPPPP